MQHGVVPVVVRQPEKPRRFPVRLASAIALCIYLTGVLTGSWLCSVTSVSSSPQIVSMDTPNRSTVKQIPQQNPAVATPSLRAPPRKTSFKPLKPEELKAPVPIIVMGLMKAGTTSIYGYFKCGLDPKYARLSHYDCKPGEDDPEKIGMACGRRMRRNITKNKKPAFHTMANFTLYAEIDAQENNGGMTLPQWEFLEEIYDNFPQATWILNLRDPIKWLNSVDRWKDLRQRFIDNPYYPTLPRGTGGTAAEMINFYRVQASRIREFCMDHPSINLVEVTIDSPDAGKIMEDAFGIPEKCWGNRNINDGKAEWKAV